MSGKTIKGTPSPAPTPPVVPESLIWTVRIGGLLATAFAAAISAQTLYRLGRLLNLAPATAWLLPGALDLCAGICIWAAAAVPAGHPGRRKAGIYATVALTMTVCCNALYHAITLGQWTWQDDSLMAVSTLPPLVVEILLHLQTIVTNEHAGQLPAAPATASDSTPADGREPAPAATAALADASATAKTAATATNPADVRDREPTSATATPPGEERPAATAKLPAANPPSAETAADKTDRAAAAGRTTRPRWVEVGLPVYEALKAQHGRRPQEKEWLTALAAEAARLINTGELPDIYDAPSMTAAKRVRTWIEEDHPHLSALHLVKGAA